MLKSKLKNWDFIDMESISCKEGHIFVFESLKNIPFNIERIYYIVNNDPSVVRGGHALKTTKQFIIPIKGSFNIKVDNGDIKKEVFLDNPKKGLLLNPITWRELYGFSEECIILCVANKNYQESDYVRDYEEFTSVINEIE